VDIDASLDDGTCFRSNVVGDFNEFIGGHLTLSVELQGAGEIFGRYGLGASARSPRGRWDQKAKVDHELVGARGAESCLEQRVQRAGGGDIAQANARHAIAVSIRLAAIDRHVLQKAWLELAVVV